MLQATPEIRLFKNQWATLPRTYFCNAANGQEAPQPTLVKIKTDDDYFYIDFDCQQNPFWNQNTYTQHNTEMWNQEVFELFIAEGDATPTRYLEIELNPNNALFVGWVDNPTKETPDNLTFVPYSKTGIKHEVTTKKATWAGKIQIPWALLGGKKSIYRFNFYRIVSLKSHSDTNWKGSPDDCAYLCWNSTMSGNTPRFHRPDAFGKLRLD